MDLSNFFSAVGGANTLGGAILLAFFTLIGVIAKGVLSNNGNITVAKINSETTLGAKAMETLTAALEVLQEENKSLKTNIKQLESHIDRLIELILLLVKAKTREEIERAESSLEHFLRAIGRWPY